jgi:hypothetical protein
MSAMAQFLPKFDVRVRSAFHPIATESQASQHFGFGTQSDVSGCSKMGRHSMTSIGERQQGSAAP